METEKMRRRRGSGRERRRGGAIGFGELRGDAVAVGWRSTESRERERERERRVG
jgi:hypothetical protein